MKKSYRILKYLSLVVIIISIINIMIPICKYLKSRMVYNDIRNKKEVLDLKNINPDYIGWINIKNTPVDYPIMKGSNNNFYLSHDINKNYLFAGSIFIDYRNNDFNDKNVLIYGHNMKDKSMFGILDKFQNKDFLQKNKCINIFDINNNLRKYEIFSIYAISAYDKEALKINFDTEKSFMSYINSIKNKSIYKINLNITKNDKIITLVTCSYKFNEARLVIHAKLLN